MVTQICKLLRASILTMLQGASTGVLVIANATIISTQGQTNVVKHIQFIERAIFKNICSVLFDLVAKYARKYIIAHTTLEDATFFCKTYYFFNFFLKKQLVRYQLHTTRLPMCRIYEQRAMKRYAEIIVEAIPVFRYNERVLQEVYENLYMKIDSENKLQYMREQMQTIITSTEISKYARTQFELMLLYLDVFADALPTELLRKVTLQDLNATWFKATHRMVRIQGYEHMFEQYFELLHSVLYTRRCAIEYIYMIGNSLALDTERYAVGASIVEDRRITEIRTKRGVRTVSGYVEARAEKVAVMLQIVESVEMDLRTVNVAFMEATALGKLEEFKKETARFTQNLGI
jgi:hypothetical protein